MYNRRLFDGAQQEIGLLPVESLLVSDPAVLGNMVGSGLGIGSLNGLRVPGDHIYTSVPSNSTPWRFPWSSISNPIDHTSYASVPGMPVVGIYATSYNGPAPRIGLGYTPTVDTLNAADGSMIEDRVLVSSSGAGGSPGNMMSACLCLDPDDPTKLLLVWSKVADGLTWTYGAGFPPPSSTEAMTYIYESTDNGATWTEISRFTNPYGSVRFAQAPNGPIQKFRDLYLVSALGSQNRRSIYYSTDKINWWWRYVDSSGAGTGPNIAFRAGNFYSWGGSGLAISPNGLDWSHYETNTTGGPWFTYRLSGDTAIRHGVFGHNGSAFIWRSSLVNTPNVSDFTTVGTYTPTINNTNIVLNRHESYLTITAGDGLLIVPLVIPSTGSRWLRPRFRLG